MKKTVLETRIPPYSLHDMQVTSFRVRKDEIAMQTATGLVRTEPPGDQPDGWVEFHGVQWEFSYAYLLRYDGLAGNVGPFRGEKFLLKEFLNRYPEPYYVILDETYGYHQAKYSGFFHEKEAIRECILEICYNGDMVFVIEE